MTDHLVGISLNKLVSTGVGLAYEVIQEPEPLPSNAADFDAMVTHYYTLFREGIRRDVDFLRSVRSSPRANSFDNTVYKLRTAKQHSDNQAAKTFYATFTSGLSWEAAAAKFLGEATAALSELEQISFEVRRDAKMRKAWRESTAVETDAVFGAVCRDLNVSFSSGRRQQLLRNVEFHRRKLAVGTDVRAAVEQFCVREIAAAQTLDLPVRYFEVLDRLSLIGHRNASAALLMAYAVRAATSLTGEHFLDRIERTWRVGIS